MESQVTDAPVTTGVLDSTISTDLDLRIMKIDPKLMIETDPNAHGLLRSEQMVIRLELKQAKEQNLAVRRAALRILLLQDFVQEDRELRQLGLAYARPGP